MQLDLPVPLVHKELPEQPRIQAARDLLDPQVAQDPPDPPDPQAAQDPPDPPDPQDPPEPQDPQAAPDPPDERDLPAAQDPQDPRDLPAAPDPPDPPDLLVHRAIPDLLALKDYQEQPRTRAQLDRWELLDLLVLLAAQDPPVAQDPSDR